MARRQVKIFINGKEIGNNIQAIQKELRALRKTYREAEEGNEEYVRSAEGIKKLNAVLKRHRDNLRTVESSWDKIRKGIGKFAGVAAAAFTATAIVSYGQGLFKLGTEMEVLGKKASIVFGQELPLVTKAAEENANAMGLTTGNYIDAAAAIGDVLIPMKFQREEAAQMSTNLVNLSGALSEWTGGQRSAEEVATILSKALTGEREQLKQLGIVISENDVKNRLAQKGLKNLTGELLQQAKATATLELITEKSVDAQAAFIENSDLSIRKQAELNAKLKDVAERLATALLPVFDRLIDLSSQGADRLLQMSSAFSNLLDPIKGATSAFDEQSNRVNDLESNLLPLLNRYDELQKSSSDSEEEQKELAEIIAKIGEITPSAITQVDQYGKVLGINANKSREFLEAEKARLAFVNKESITTLEEEIQKLEERREVLQKNVEIGRGLTFFSQGVEIELTDQQIKTRLESLREVSQTLKGAQAELERLRGGNLNTPATNQDEQKSPDVSPTQDEILAQAERAAKLQKQREKQAEAEQKRKEREAEAEAKRLEVEAEKQLEALESSLENLKGKTEQFQQDFEKSQLSQRAQALARA